MISIISYRIRVKVLNQRPLGWEEVATVGGAAFATVKAHTGTVRNHLGAASVDCELKEDYVKYELS